MKKTVTTSFALPRIVYEAFQEFAEAVGRKPSHILQDYVSDVVGIAIGEASAETIAQKYNAILDMDSVYPATKGKYPAKRTFYDAFHEDRVIYRDDGSVLLYSTQKKKCYCFIPRSLKG